MSTLVVVAHADDETLGCGGTITGKVAVACAGRQHYNHLENAAKILGVDIVSYQRWPDQRLDGGTMKDIVHWVESLIKTHQPHTVYTHFAGDLNRDHRIVSEAVSVACRPYASSVKRLLQFEVPSSTEYGEAFKPNVFVELSDEAMDKKCRALECYETEVRPPPHPRHFNSLRYRARYWGQQIGVTYAEPFVLVREIR